MLGIALKGIPRENYRLMTKVTTGDGKDPQTKIDELRRLAQTDYFDRDSALAGCDSGGGT
jgi:hypothetical protein